MSPANQPGEHNAASQQKQLISRLAQNGDIDRARQLCTSLCEQDPGDPEAWFLLGAINGAVEDYPEAEMCCKKAIALAPEQPMLRYNLAVALLRQQKAPEAIEHFECAIALQPDFADAYCELGNAQAMNNEPLRAISSFEKSARLNPGSATTLVNLGNTYLNLNRLDEAGKCFQQAITLQADLVAACYGLASTLIQQFRLEKAIEFLNAGIERMPDAASLYSLLALAHQNQGDADVAMTYYEKTLSIDPDATNARAGIAGIMAFQGRYDEAGKILEPLLASHPDNEAVKTTYTTLAHHFGAADKAVEVAERELENAGATARTKATHHFALAHLHERKGDFDTAFEHYASGNRLRGAQFNYASYDKMFQAIADNYSAEAMARLPRSGNSSDTLIFIVGMPRSGTSLAEQVLASHPDVFGAGELRNIKDTVDKLPLPPGSPPYPFCLDRLTGELLSQLAGKYLEDVKDLSGGSARYFTDKQPINFVHLGFISLLFPNAKFIHCTRDPRDTCLSCFFKLFSGELPYAYSLTDLGKFYRLYQRMMTHWKRVLPTPIYELNYENMVLNQETETRKLVEFCGLDWDDACLDFHKADRTVSTASYDQVRQPMYTSSVGRWRNYERHLEPLFTALRQNT